MKIVSTNKWWIRFLVVFLIHIMFKSFDYSFPNGPFELKQRSFAFSIYFIGFGLFMWFLAAKFDQLLSKKYTSSEGNREKVLLITFWHFLLATPLAFLFNHLYRVGDIHFYANEELWETIPLINPEFTLSIVSIYLIIFGFASYLKMFARVKEVDLNAERLKKESIKAQYLALKAQIEPHFLFNSLSVLSSLVYEDTELSSNFIVKLSRTLRYIIEKNEFHLVNLSEELDFLDSYFFLIKTRLDKGVYLENKLEKQFIDTTLIPPVTLQLLVENAINHNKYNPENPLRIIIQAKNDHIVVSNNLNPRESIQESTKKGLKNISKRYELISDLRVKILRSDDQFVVQLPVLNSNDYEGFNI